MEKDRELFQKVREAQEKPFLRFYQWKTPTLSYGRTQGIDANTQIEYEAKGWEIVRRPSGGGKVLHQGDLCYTLVWRKEDDALPWEVSESYCAIHRWVKISLERLGFSMEQRLQKNSSDKNSWCFQNPIQYDILSQGEKIIGGAQWREGNTALHQGSIQLEKLGTVPLGTVPNFSNFTNFSVSSLTSAFKSNFESFFNIKFCDEVLC